jgi:putative transposase
VLDLLSRKVVGWAMQETMAQDLTLDVLRMGITNRRPGPGLLHHADHGGQYAARTYRRPLETEGMLCSMSRKGDCWDNAHMESSLKTELEGDGPSDTRPAARSARFRCIEGFDNRERQHSAIGYHTPMQMEASAAVA